jgi:threonine/homoserine/homoserine lactone efflux protein
MQIGMQAICAVWIAAAALGLSTLGHADKFTVKTVQGNARNSGGSSF